MKWFKHMADASDDAFIEQLEEMFGLEGYARWWKLVETIARSMDKNTAPFAEHSWVKWQTFLKGKRNKLEMFLKQCELQGKIKLEQNGNILKITCPKLLELKDEYTRKSGHTPKHTPDTVAQDTDTEKEEDNNIISAREPDEKKPSEWVTMIAAYDDLVFEVFGSRRMPSANDSGYAKRWFEAGVTPDHIRVACLASLQKFNAEQQQPPVMKYFDNAISRALEIPAGELPKAEKPRAKQTPADRAKSFAWMRNKGLLHGSDASWLEQYEAQHGSVTA